jgi:hypothetical protein
MKGECRGAIERIRGIVGGGTGTARSQSPAREARSQDGLRPAMVSRAVRQNGVACVPWPEARGSSFGIGSAAVGGYTTLAACFDWVSAGAFLVDRDGG